LAAFIFRRVGGAESLPRFRSALFASNLTGNLKIRIANNRNACRFRALASNASSFGEDAESRLQSRTGA
jgi:hypothetical protein